MDRSRFLRTTAALTLGTACSLSGCRPEHEDRTDTPPPGPQETIKWKLVTTWPPGFPVLGEGCSLLAGWIREMSGGTLDIRVYGAGELIPAMEVFDAVSTGTAQMASSAAYYWAGKIPAAQFFGSVPFGMNAQQMNSWLMAGGGMALWEHLYAPHGIIPFPCGNTGIQMGGWFRKEIRSIQDLAGLKMRIPGLGGKVLERAGGTAVLSAGSEIYTNLERGVIDATEWIGPYHDVRMGFGDIARYYYFPGWHEPGSTLELMVNKDAFEALPGWLKEVVRTAALRLHNWVLAEFDTQNARYLKQITSQPGIEIRRFPGEVLRFLQTKTREVLNDLVASDPASKEIHDAYFEHFNLVRDWFRISEWENYRLSFAEETGFQ